MSLQTQQEHWVFFPVLLHTSLPSLLNLNALYFLVFGFRNLLKLQFAHTRQGLEKPSFPLRHVVPPHSSSGPTPSLPVPGSPHVPPFPSSTHQNPWNRKTVHTKKGFGTNTETQEVSRSVLSRSVFLVPKHHFYGNATTSSGPKQVPLRKGCLPRTRSQKLSQRILPFFSTYNLFFCLQRTFQHHTAASIYTVPR